MNPVSYEIENEVLKIKVETSDVKSIEIVINDCDKIIHYIKQ